MWNHRQDQSSLSLLAYLNDVGDMCNTTHPDIVSKHGRINGHYFDRIFDRKPPSQKAKYLTKVKQDPYCEHAGC